MKSTTSADIIPKFKEVFGSLWKMPNLLSDNGIQYTRGNFQSNSHKIKIFYILGVFHSTNSIWEGRKERQLIYCKGFSKNDADIIVCNILFTVRDTALDGKIVFPFPLMIIRRIYNNLPRTSKIDTNTCANYGDIILRRRENMIWHWSEMLKWCNFSLNREFALRRDPKGSGFQEE